MSRLDRRLEPEGTVRRFKVIDGTVGRTLWSSDDEARILDVTFVPDAAVSVVARRRGLTLDLDTPVFLDVIAAATNMARRLGRSASGKQ